MTTQHYSQPKAACFLNTWLASQGSPPVNATFSAPSCPERKGMNLSSQRIVCPMQEAACCFSSCIPKLFHRATRWQLGQMVSAFNFYSHSPREPRGFLVRGAELGNEKLGELRVLGAILRALYRGHFTWFLWQHLVNISLRLIKTEKHRQ